MAVGGTVMSTERGIGIIGIGAAAGTDMKDPIATVSGRENIGDEALATVWAGVEAEGEPSTMDALQTK